MANRRLLINDTYNRIFDNRQQTNNVCAMSQILQNLYFAFDFLLFHRLHRKKTTSVLHMQTSILTLRPHGQNVCWPRSALMLKRQTDIRLMLYCFLLWMQPAIITHLNTKKKSKQNSSWVLSQISLPVG